MSVILTLRGAGHRPKFPTSCGRVFRGGSLLPWVEEKQEYQGSTKEMYGLPRAVVYREEEDEWRVGVCLLLSGQLSVIFGVVVTENEGQYSVAVGDRKGQLVDLNVQTQSEAFFASLVQMVKDSFNEPRKIAKGLGFHVQTS